MSLNDDTRRSMWDGIQQAGNMILTPEDAALLVRERSWTMAHTPSAEDEQYFYELFSKIRECAAMVPPPLNGDKVWCGLTTRLTKNGTPHNQCRTIVRERTGAAAFRLLVKAGECISMAHFRRYWVPTGNREELVLAMERGVWVKGPKGWIKK